MLSFLSACDNRPGRRVQSSSKNIAGLVCEGKDNLPCIPAIEEQNRKSWRWIFRLFTILIVAISLHITVQAESPKVSISVKNASLEQVFKEIQRQTDYGLIYDLEVLHGTKPVSFSVRDVSVEELLDIALKGQPLVYSVVGKSVFIKRKSDEQKGLSSSILTVDPPKVIKARGIVLDEAGRPLAGANITIKETGHGTITNAKGEYVFPEIQVSSTLVVSFIGYASQQVKVVDESSMKVYLTLAKSELDKAIVQAYGTTTQRLATGNIATVSAAEIERQPVMNPLEALYGKVPGLVVTQTSGYASGPISVEIRGRANINGIPSNPLFIVDGVPLSLQGTGNGNGFGLIQPLSDGSVITGPAIGQSPLFSINPADIESMTVLKDADATAIYGSRGANGVVIIATKRGKAGKTKLDVNVYQGMQKITGHYDLLNISQYISMRREALKNDGIIPDGGNAYDLLTWDTTRNIDFQKLFWNGLGKETDIQTGISGGDKQTNFRISGGYHRQTSIFSFSGADQRGSVQFNLTHRSLNQRLAISFSNLYSYTQSDLVGLSGSVTSAPNTPAVFDKSGNLNYAGWTPISNQFPYASLRQPYKAKTGFLNSTLNLQYQLIRGLSASTQIGYSTTHLYQENIQPIVSYDLTTNPKGASQFANSNQSIAIIEPQLEYKETFFRGKVDALVGGTYQSTSYDGNLISGSGYTDDNLVHSVASAPIKSASDGFTQYKYTAVFGRLTYNWDDKYIVNLSARRDGSTRFGPGNQFGDFGAVGLAWIFTEERWSKQHLPFLSFGKLRGSYGLTGSDQIPDYQFLTRWSGSAVLPYNNVPTYVPTQHANPLLHWQTNKKLEAALDLGFLNDRLNIEVAWYRNRCGDELLSYQLPGITGFTYVYANFPATVQNNGLEGIFKAKLIEKKEIQWSFNFNIGINRNKLLAFPGIEQSPYFGTYFVGEPLNIAQVLHYTGVDPLTGKYTYLDKNKDGQIDPYPGDANNDLFVKDLSIKFDGGFGSDFQYRGWQVNLLFNFRKQELRSATFNGFPGQLNLNQSVQVLDHWQKPGDMAKFARFTTNPDQSYYYFLTSDAGYSDGSYIRLKNVSVSYELPQKWFKNAGFQKCMLYLRAQNLFILTKYDGLDPDVPGLGSLPPAKVFTAGIQVNL